jgi:hypothetical protein
MPPVFMVPKLDEWPPQTIISVPAQTAVWYALAAGALVVEVAVQESLTGLYMPPEFR